MAINIKSGNNTPGLANVGASYGLNVVTPNTTDGSGFLNLGGLLDYGLATGNRIDFPLDVSDDYRLRTGIDQSIFNLSFEGIAQPFSHLEQNTFNGMTNGQTAGYFLLNSGATGVSGGVSYTRTYRHFPVYGTYPTYMDVWLRETGFTATNAQSEWGFFDVPSGSEIISNPTSGTSFDGAYFRRISGGSLFAVLNNNSLELSQGITTSILVSKTGTTYSPQDYNHYVVSYHNDGVRYWVNERLVSQINLSGSTFVTPSASSNLPVGFRVLNTETSSTPTRQMYLGFVNVAMGDQNSNRSYEGAMAGAGNGSYQNQSGVTFSRSTVTRGTGSTAGWPDSGTGLTSGAWVTTSGPAKPSLGGFWLTPLISSLTSDADYPVFSWQNYPPNQRITGKSLYITGINVGDSFAVTAASTNAIFLSFIAAVGSTINTSTADSATAFANRPIMIGGHGFTAGATPGTVQPGFSIKLNSPLVIPPNCFFQFIIRPAGVVTSNTLTVQGRVSVNGYFE